MAKKNKGVTFKTVEEYKAYYTTDTKEEQPKGSKYYRIGSDIAKMACDRAVQSLPKTEESRIANVGLERSLCTPCSDSDL